MVAEKPSVCFFADPVAVHGGKTQGNAQRYYVSEQVLCKQSDYFVKAFKGPFREANEKVIHFDDDEPEIFEIILRWLCTRNALINDSRDSRAGQNYDTGDKLRRIKSWIFGDKYGLECFQKHLIVCGMKMVV